MSNHKKVLTFGGGVGGGKFLSGLYEFRKDLNINVYVNTSDDIDIYGVRVSPDIDSVLYWISGLVDPSRGWGIKDDTFNMIKNFDSSWFNLGDKDFEFNLEKKKYLDNNLELDETIKIKTTKLNIDHISIFPMTNDKVETYINSDLGDMHIQEYLIKYRMSPQIRGIEFRNIMNSKPIEGLIDNILNADLIIFCPSNPIISVEPILTMDGIRGAIESSKAKKIAISPIIGNFAFQGPIMKLLKFKGLEASPVGIGQYYKNIIDYIVLDKSDKDLLDKIKDLNIHCIFENIKMDHKTVSIGLAGKILEVMDF